MAAGQLPPPEDGAVRRALHRDQSLRGVRQVWCRRLRLALLRQHGRPGWYDRDGQVLGQNSNFFLNAKETSERIDSQGHVLQMLIFCEGLKGLNQLEESHQRRFFRLRSNSFGLRNFLIN